MAGQSYVDAYGASTHAYTVSAVINKAIDNLSQRASIVGGLGWDAEGRERLVLTKDIGGESRDIGNTGCIQTKEINVGDEARFSLALDFQGRLTHGAAPVEQGQYPEFLHDNVRMNVADSPEFQLWDEMSRQRFANLIDDMDMFTQQQIALYMGKWADLMFLQACFHGADEGQLLTTSGGLGLQLWNAASAGYVCSPKNIYVGGSGMVTWNANRATYEAAVGSAIYGLTDTTGDGFSLTSHEAILNQINNVLRFPMVDAFGLKLRAVCLIDPWLIRRILLRNSNNTWYTLMKDADVRGPKNHMIDQDQSVIIDKILYIPCDWLRAFRPYGSDAAQPTYGAGITADPQVYIATADTASLKCAALYMGAQAMLCAKSNRLYTKSSGQRIKTGRIWVTERPGVHGKGGGLSAHTKVGFKRRLLSSKDGGSMYLNNNFLAAFFYDPGPGESFAA